MEFTSGSYRRVFREGERVVLTVEARWPRPAWEGAGARRMGRYYDALFRRWRERWEGPLLERARAAAQGPAGAPSLPWSAGLDYTVTFDQDGLFSLYLDAVEDTGARRPRRVRQGDVWLVPQGLPVTLPELLPPRRWWRAPVIEEVRRQIGERLAAGEALYYDGWPALASQRFSPQRFYLTGEGAAVFYPVESIAPALEGFPTFLCPLRAPEPAK